MQICTIKSFSSVVNLADSGRTSSGRVRHPDPTAGLRGHSLHRMLSHLDSYDHPETLTAVEQVQ